MIQSRWFWLTLLGFASLGLPAAAQDITSSMLGHWRLVETSGTAAVDATSTVQNGTYTNGVLLASSAPAPKDGAISATFDGADDYVAVASESTFDITGAMTVACWIKVDVFDAQWQAIVTKGDTAWRLTRDDNNNGVRFTCTGLTTPQVVSVGSVNDGQWHHVVGVYNGSQLLIYVDGTLNNSVASSGAITTNNVAVQIGRNASVAGKEFDGAIYDGRVYNRALSGPDISALYNLTGLIAHWKLNETSGTTATDLSPHVNNGTCANGVTLAASGPYPGAGDKAASFDGTDDHITTANEYLYDIRGPITVAAWIRVNAFTVGSQAIVTKGDGAWRLIRNGTTNQVRFQCNGLSDTNVNSTTDVNDGQWHHVVGVYNGSTLSIYVDGVLEAADTSTGAISNTAHNVFIGENSQTAGRYWNGAIHDVRVYSVALSTVQIADLYGMIGHWKLNETTGGTAADSSLFASGGTVSGGQNWSTTCNGTGVFDFDGSSNLINVPNSTHLQPTSTMTIAAWIKGDSWGSSGQVDAILRKGEGDPNNYQLAIADGRVTLFLDDSDTAGIRGNTVLSAGQWYHVAATWNGSTVKIFVNGQLDNTPAARTGSVGTDGRPLYIGGQTSGDFFDGMIYDVRFFNRACSDSDIARLYGVSGHWKFDEGTGVTAADSSGLGHSATLIGTAGWTTDCSGNALVTDGLGGIAQTAAAFLPPATGTISFWMQCTGSPASGHRIFGLSTNWEARYQADGTVAFDLNGDASSVVVTTAPLNVVGRWYHVAISFDSTTDTYAMYVDGILDHNGTNAMTQQAAAILSFGTRTGTANYWQGALRDFRVYNRRLCASEIAELFGLVGHWTLDETAGTTAVDASLAGNNATYQGSPTLGVQGRVSNSVQFDGSNDAITNQTFYPPSTGTVTFWMRRAGAPTGRERFFGVNGNWEIWQDPDGLIRCDLGGDGFVGGFESATTMVAPSKWYHFAATFDAVADTFAIYIDGVLDVSGSMALAPQSAAQLSIAARTGLAIERFQGTLDDVCIYNRILCPAEIQALHNGSAFEGVKVIKWVEIQ